MDLPKLAFWSTNILMPGWNVSFCTSFLEGQLAMCAKRLKNIPNLWRGFPDGSAVKNRPAIQKPQKIQFRSLGWEDPREGNDYLLRYSCLENSMDKIPGGLQSIGLQRIRHDWSNLTCTLWPNNSIAEELITNRDEVLEMRIFITESFIIVTSGDALTVWPWGNG